MVICVCAVWNGRINAIICVVHVVAMVEVVVICCRGDYVVHGDIYGGLDGGVVESMVGVPRAWWLCVVVLDAMAMM